MDDQRQLVVEQGAGIPSMLAVVLSSKRSPLVPNTALVVPGE
jgi:hypothetical protein